MKKIAASFLSLCFIAACAPDEPPPAADAGKKTQAQLDKEDLERRKAEREKKKKEEEEKKKAHQAKIDALLVLPEKLPKDIKAACEENAAAYDAFMGKHYADKPDVKAKWEQGKKMQLDMRKKQCMASSVETAACQTSALNNAPAELKKEIPAFLKGCMDKFDKKDAAAAAPAGGEAPKKG